MRFATLGSGSAGNATIVEHKGSAVLIDCGLSARQAQLRADAIDFDLGSLDALLITHEHDDHVAGAAALARRYGIPVFGTAGTLAAAERRLGGIASFEVISPETNLSIGALNIEPVIVPHDAREPCQFILSGGSKRLGILTDVGQITAHLTRSYCGLNGLVLEFNHDPELLATSPYPTSLKRRIGGDYGHLSNAQAEDLLQTLDLSALEYFTAAHLSEKTNTPAHVASCLDRCLSSKVVQHIADQGQASPWSDLG